MDPFRRPIPLEPEQPRARASSELGRPRATFGLSAKQRTRLVLGRVGVPVMVLVGLACLQLSAAILAWLCCAIPYLVVSLYRLRRHLTERAVLHEDGIVVHGFRSSNSMAFDDVDEVWYEMKVTNDVAHISTLRLRDHVRHDLRVLLEVDRASELMKTIIDRCSLSMLDDAVRSLERGETLTFGDVKIDTRGISVGDKGTAWRRLARTEIGRRRVVMYTTSGFVWWAIAHDEVPHPALFVELVRRLGPPVSKTTPVHEG